MRQDIEAERPHNWTKPFSGHPMVPDLLVTPSYCEKWEVKWERNWKNGKRNAIGESYTVKRRANKKAWYEPSGNT